MTSKLHIHSRSGILRKPHSSTGPFFLSSHRVLARCLLVSVNKCRGGTISPAKLCAETSTIFEKEVGTWLLLAVLDDYLDNSENPRAPYRRWYPSRARNTIDLRVYLTGLQVFISDHYLTILCIEIIAIMRHSTSSQTGVAHCCHIPLPSSMDYHDSATIVFLSNLNLICVLAAYVIYIWRALHFGWAASHIRVF
jgi:small-conductance mechanosensitive channel